MKKPRKIPIRKCVVSGEQLAKGDLLRVVKTKEGNVFVDPSGKMNGRGAYVKRSRDVIDKAQKNKRLERALETTIADEVYDALRRQLDDDA